MSLAAGNSSGQLSETGSVCMTSRPIGGLAVSWLIDRTDSWRNIEVFEHGEHSREQLLQTHMHRERGREMFVEADHMTCGSVVLTCCSGPSESAAQFQLRDVAYDTTVCVCVSE